jgi:nitrite reductase/ring-hydroxylating ferredoxin subunit
MREESRFECVATLDQLSEGMPLGVQLSAGERVCLIRVEGDVYAVQDRCTHADFPMSDGDMVDDFVIECSLHGAQFDIRNGEVIESPADDRLPTYEVRLKNGEVWVRPSDAQ